jgi:hypothetical protein
MFMGHHVCDCAVLLPNGRVCVRKQLNVVLSKNEYGTLESLADNLNICEDGCDVLGHQLSKKTLVKILLDCIHFE